MKKIYLIIIFILLSFLFYTTVDAYSTTKFSIDIPVSYHKVITEESFTDAYGNNINIQITPFSGSASKAFTNENLDSLVNTLKNEIDRYKAEMKKTIKERYGEYFSDSYIDEYVKSFKVKSIDKKEITTATKNNYKCFHIIANYSVGDYSTYLNQYTFISNNEVYTLTISASNKEDFESAKIKDVIRSFTIKNYKNPESFFSSTLWNKIIVMTISAAILYGIKILIEKKVNNKKNNEENNTINYEQGVKNITTKEDIKEYIEEDKKIIKSEEKNIEKVNNDTDEGKEQTNTESKAYCTKCGEAIEEDWDYCNNCGNKLK